MQVHRRRATPEDVDTLLELVNAAYKHEGRWKVDDTRTSAEELKNLIPDQVYHAESNSYQVLLVLAVDNDQDISSLPASARQSRIVGHIRYEIRCSKD